MMLEVNLTIWLFQPYLQQSYSVQSQTSYVMSMQCAQVGDWQTAKSIYEFSAKDIDGNEVSLEKYR